MDDKNEAIDNMLKSLQRILNKQMRIEDLHVHFGEGVEATPKEIHTIEAIGKYENLNVKEVAEHFGVTKSAASQIISKLENKGFVNKEFAENSNREYELSLTDSGWKAFHAHEKTHGKHLADLAGKLDSFTISQITIATVLLDVVEDVMEQRLSTLPGT